MRLMLFLLLISFFSPLQPAHASFVDGNVLLQKCQAKEREATYFQDRSYCIAYIIGVSDSIGFFQIAPDIPEAVCIPANASSGQVRDVVVKFLEDNPAERHRAAEALVFTALAISFRCKAQ